MPVQINDSSNLYNPILRKPLFVNYIFYVFFLLCAVEAYLERYMLTFFSFYLFQRLF